MKVLKGKILVAVHLKSVVNSLVKSHDDIDKGIVHLSSSEEIDEGLEVLFGDKYEEIVLDNFPSTTTKYYLMKEDNIKIIYDDPSPPTESKSNNILNFEQKDRQHA